MPKKPPVNVSLYSPPRTNPFIWCLAVICTVITLAVIVAGIVVFIGYLVIRPTPPFVRVTYAHLDLFDFDQTGVLTTKLTIVINAQNDNLKAHASFSDFRYVLRFNGIKVAVLKVPDPFDVGKNESQPLVFRVEASPIPLDPHQMTFADLSLKKNVIAFELNGHSRARWRVGPLGSVRFPCNMNCQLHFQTDGTCVFSNCNSKFKKETSS